MGRMKHELDFDHDSGGGWFVKLGDQYIPVPWSQIPVWCATCNDPICCTVTLETVERGVDATSVAVRISDVERQTDSLVVAGIADIVGEMRRG